VFPFSIIFFDAGAMKFLTAISSILVVISQIHLVCAQSSITYTISTFDQTKLTGLSLACDNVYNANISSCQMTDFLPSIPCTSSCITSLNGIQTEAQAACSGVPVSPSSMLSLFVNGSGVQELCTTQKLASSTLTTSITSGTMTPSGTTSPTSSPSASAAMVQGGASSGTSLSHGAVISIVVAVLIAIAVLVVIGTVIFRKNYTN
jgi:hypothetical protein